MHGVFRRRGRLLTSFLVHDDMATRRKTPCSPIGLGTDLERA